MSDLSRVTRAMRAGIDSDTAFGAVIPPIHLSTNYAFAGFGEQRAHDYSRGANPTRDVLAEALNTLEGGAGAVVCSSGMAAITTVILPLLSPNDTIAVPHDAYGGSWRLFHRLAERGHFRVITIDFTRTEAACARLAQEKPTLVWLETPSNPLLAITDLSAVVDAAKEIGAKVAVDNTFLTPLLQRPLELGADVVIHSTTKYLNGHSDVIAGAVVAADTELFELFNYWAKTLGTTGSAFDSWLVMRGLRSLHARMRTHQENAAAIAAVLSEHPAVGRVFYPGLADHPGHEVAARQQDGFGGMVTFELDGTEDVRAFLDGLRCFTLAESLGGTESLVSHPVTMTHASMSPEALAEAGLTDGLLRLSVGLEDVDDLVSDLMTGLNRVNA